MTSITIPISSIRVGPRVRALREESIAVLMESISTLGLQNAITVRPHSFFPDGAVRFEEGYVLIAGLHRLETCKRLGHTEIEAKVATFDEAQRQLWEIDENLCRADLFELERGQHLLKRKEIYEWWKPETKAGIAQAIGMHRKLGHDVGANLAPTLDPAFVADTVAKTGASETSIKRSIRRANKIDKEVQKLIATNEEIADSGVELDALAKLSADDQKRAVGMVTSGEARNVREASRRVIQAPSPPARAEEHVAIDAVKRLSEEAFGRFDSWYIDYRTEKAKAGSLNPKED